MTLLRFFLAAFLLPSSVAFAQYKVQLDPGARSLSLSLTLPASATEPIKLATRGKDWGLREQVSEVRCDGKELFTDQSGSWIAPAGCAVVSWKIVPDAVPAEGIDVSTQRSLAIGDGPWILLAEPTSLLRPHTVTEPMTISAANEKTTLFGASRVRPNAFRVPSASAAPEFYVLGNASISQKTVGPVQVAYAADRPERVEKLGLETRHASALAYLLKVVSFPGADTSADRSLLVVWIGVSESSGVVGGAAGSRSFIANYAIGSPKNNGRNVALTTTIIAHEQFHQLVEMVRSAFSRPQLALWIGESLAHYYGLKAMSVSDDSPDARAVWAKFIDLQRPVEHGLRELNRRYDNGDQSVYHLFYSQGATFWHALDSAITAATNGKQTLDDFVNEILRSQAAADGALPDSFVEKLRSAAGASIDQILSKYVGR